jgi:hypothetical protein
LPSGGRAQRLRSTASRFEAHDLIWVDKPEGANRNDIPRVAPIATLLLFGLRVEALCDLDGADVDFARGVVRSADKTLGHTNPNFMMSVYQQVLDMTAGAEESFEKVTGASFAEAFATLSERDLPTIFRPLTAAAPSQRFEQTDA